MPINNSTLPSREEFLRRKRKQRIRKYVIFFFSIVILIAFVSYISHRPEIRVTKVQLKGGVLVTEEDILKKSTEYMSGSYFWLFPKNTSIWYPKDKLKEYLKQNFKRIDNIEVGLDGFRTLVVTIEERKPFAIWCDSTPNKTKNEISKISTTTDNVDEVSVISEQTCYFIDQNSTIFSEAPYFSGDAYFKYYGEIGTTSPVGSFYISSSTEFEEITDFISTIKNFSLHPRYLFSKGGGDYTLVISGGGEIYFDMKKPLKETAKNLESLLRTPSLSTSTNSDLPIQYIDLRYGNKLFYKLKTE